MIKNRYGFCFVFDPAGRVLVIRRAEKSRNRPGEWDLPGGVIEQYENTPEGVVREVFEETGLHIHDLEQVVSRGGEWQGEEHEFSYFRASIDVEKVNLSHEHSEYEWHDPLVAATMITYRPHVYGLGEAHKLLAAHASPKS